MNLITETEPLAFTRMDSANQQPEAIIEIIEKPHLDEKSQSKSTPNSQEDTRMDTTSIQETSNQLIQSQQFSAIQKFEVEMDLVKIVCFFLAVILASGYVLLMSHFNNSPDGLFIICLTYFAFVLLLELLCVSRKLGTAWKNSYHIFKFYDAFNGFFCTVCLLLKKCEIIPTCSFACVPIQLQILSMLFNFRRMKLKLIQIGIRLYYTIQFLAIALKLEGQLASDWTLILLPSLFFIVVVLSILTVRIRTLLIRLSQTETTEDNSVSKKTQIIGFFWHLSYYGSILLAFLLFPGVITALSPGQDMELLIQGASASLFVSTLLVIWTLFCKRYLVEFILAYKIDDEDDLLELETVKIHGINLNNDFVTETRENYFVKISPTYFHPLHKTPSSADKETVSKIKLALQQIKKNSTSKLQNFNHSAIEFNQEYAADQQEDFKYAYSVNDIDGVRKTKDLEVYSEPNEEDNLCYICYKNTSDAILEECGHGGICYDCALLSIKKNAKCNECRADVTGVYKIGPHMKFDNIVKGFQLSKLELNI